MDKLNELAGTDPKRQERLRKAEEEARKKVNGHALGRNDPRPLIQLRGGGLAEHTRDAMKALAGATAADPFTGTYARGGQLVRPLPLGSEKRDGKGITRPAGALQLIPVDSDYLRLELTRVIQFQKYAERQKAWVDTDAPKAVAESVLAAAPWREMPNLAGIIEAPTLREDGTLLDRPGFDEASGLLFDPGGATFPPIPARPSRRQAEAALDLLLEVLSGFPFADDASKAVAVSEQITALVRRSLRSAPLFVNTAPKMASGKTLLASIPAYLEAGRPPAMMSQADKPEDERKRLLAILLEGASMVVIDNVERPLKSDALCSILTEPVFKDRVLGHSRTASAPTNAMFLATGNNLVIEGDLTTRALVCALDPMCERPEEREFDVDLHQEVPARRGELVGACLTIVLAYLAAGSPPQGHKPFGRFEAWAAWCRDPLVWLGMTDPCSSRQRIESRDPVREDLRTLLTAWHVCFGEAKQTVAGAVNLKADGENYNALREAIEGIALEGRNINVRKLGRYLSQHEGRIEDGLSFRQAGTRSRAALWKVEEVTP